jgi:hypothetical protein
METSVGIILSFMQDNIPHKEANSVSASSTPIPDGTDTTVVSVSDSEQESLNDVRSVQSSSIKKYIHSEETTPDLGLGEKNEIVSGEKVHEEMIREGGDEEKVTEEVSKDEKAPEEVSKKEKAPEEAHRDAITEGTVTQDTTVIPPSEHPSRKQSTQEGKTVHSTSSETLTNSISERNPPQSSMSSEHLLTTTSTKPPSFPSTPSQPILLLCNVPPLTLIESSCVVLRFYVDF